MPSGYYRFPTLHADTVIFVCEDDLWILPAEGGVARRLTSNLGEVSRPALSPDGSQLAFVGREEGQAEIYCMPAQGGQAYRLTYLGAAWCQTAGWTADGRILFTSNAGHWETSFTQLFTLDPRPEADGLPPVRLNLGPARSAAFGPQGGLLLGRFTGEPARWKRYRGGMSGRFWIDLAGNGEFRPFLKELNGNLTSPMWLGGAVAGNEDPGRIYFISDHEGVGNLYSCQPAGDDVRRHTDHEAYYARNAVTDGRRIVYHAGGDLYLFDPHTDLANRIDVEFHSPQTQRNRKFVSAERYLESWDLHPRGHSLALATRGNAYTLGNWEGAVVQLRPPEAGPEQALQDPSRPATAVRVRLPTWLCDGTRLIAVSDAGGEEAFVIFHMDETKPPERLEGLDIGRPEAIVTNPVKGQVVFSNQRYELMFLDLETRTLRLIDRGKAAMVEKGLARPISGFSWSPDGDWLVYSAAQSLQTAQLKLWRADTGETIPLTQPVLRDVAPAFDPQGQFIYFLSYRTFDPVYDNLHFDLNFPRGMKPYLITLQADRPSPFIPRLPEEPPVSRPAESQENEAEKGPEQAAGDATAPASTEKTTLSKVQIDLEGIQDRVVGFPVSEGLYGRVLGVRDGKVLYSRYPIEGGLSQPGNGGEPPANGTLFVYTFEEQKEEQFAAGVTGFDVSPDGTLLSYRSGNRLRVLKAGEKPDERNNHTASRKSGWIDLERVKVSVLPGAEWRQMFREAWRLQRDGFWNPDMSNVNWLDVHDRYLPLVNRVSTRSEFSDLMWEMQGELGTSHAYEFGGDYRSGPYYGVGFLGAEYAYEPQDDSWRVTHIIQGDAWDAQASSPFGGPGVNVRVGDRLLAINGRRLGRRLSPGACLVNLAGEEVRLTVAGPAGEGQEAGPAASQAKEAAASRTVTVRSLRSEVAARYREWVEGNRRRVHTASGGRLGYLHIPDMGPRGYAEFHRGYLAEVDRQGLIVDVRFNHGGHVSWLLLEKLARRRIGYDLTRWSDQAIPYPLESVAGPLVALTNESAGSDGDIFSHGFKLLKLGPLIGKRTWGGVVGIEPRAPLVDGTITTQPEFALWFTDVGWQVENYGTDPDIEVDIRPQDYAHGVDAQLERGILVALDLLEAAPPQAPEFGSRPSRALPRLPKR